MWIAEEDLLNTSERSMQMRVASYKSWAMTKDRAARTAAARRRSHHDRFVEQAREMHPDGTEEQIAQAAEALKKAYYAELARRSAQSRRLRREQAEAAKQERVDQLLSSEADADGAAA
jgi:hypothetical protein